MQDFYILENVRPNFGCKSKLGFDSKGKFKGKFKAPTRIYGDGDFHQEVWEGHKMRGSVRSVLFLFLDY